MRDVPSVSSEVTPFSVRYSSAKTEARNSAVSWSAIAAGAITTIAISLMLLALGAGTGLSSISPWSNEGVSPRTVGTSALLWLAFVAVVSSSAGGYLAGRLRTKWVNVHSDEVYFRDTAHGFLVWAFAMVICAAFLTSTANTMVGQGLRETGAQRTDLGTVSANRYYVDSLFRAAQTPTPNDEAMRSEATLIFDHAVRDRQISDEDHNYLAHVIAVRTGISDAEAQKRVMDMFDMAVRTLDATRKAVAHALYWIFASMLAGAFFASFAATLGGRERDFLKL